MKPASTALTVGVRGHCNHGRKSSFPGLEGILFSSSCLQMLFLNECKNKMSFFWMLLSTVWSRSGSPLLVWSPWRRGLASG